ncbi:transglycosylase SLT domain-containing protein [Uniformispora flossi]|uniref:C40 family peptidase n=1 Tax=Uniformispora flossi TaxID=3390723 RepID=UPI003C2B84ED
MAALTLALGTTVVTGCAAWRLNAADVLDIGLDYFGLNHTAAEEIPDTNVLSAINNAVRLYPCEGVVSEPVLAGIVWVESGGNVNTPDSSAGAQGVAQFMPATWNGSGGQQAAKVDGNGDGKTDIKNPYDAIAATAKYLCTLRDEVKANNVPGDLLRNTIGAYNTGVPNVKKAGGVDNIPGVKKYVDNVLAKRDTYTLDVSGPAVDARAASFGLEIVRQARTQLGKPYVWGGGSITGPTSGGFDCSALVQYAVYQARTTFKIKPNAPIPRTTGTQVIAVNNLSSQARLVPNLDSMVPGDAIYMATKAAGVHHVVIFTGRTKDNRGKDDYGIVEAPHTGLKVRNSTLLSQYGSETFTIVRYS